MTLAISGFKSRRGIAMEDSLSLQCFLQIHWGSDVDCYEIRAIDMFDFTQEVMVDSHHRLLKKEKVINQRCIDLMRKISLFGLAWYLTVTVMADWPNTYYSLVRCLLLAL